MKTCKVPGCQEDNHDTYGGRCEDHWAEGQVIRNRNYDRRLLLFLEPDGLALEAETLGRMQPVAA